jgi:hypothetical protein
VHPAVVVARETQLLPAMIGQAGQGIDVCHQRSAGKTDHGNVQGVQQAILMARPDHEETQRFSAKPLERPYEQVVNQARLRSQDNGYLRLSCAPLPPSSQVNTKAPQIPPLVTKGVSSPAGNWTVVPSLHIATTLLTTPR